MERGERTVLFSFQTKEEREERGAKSEILKSEEEEEIDRRLTNEQQQIDGDGGQRTRDGEPFWGTHGD